jgi:hypothetical protein
VSSCRATNAKAIAAAYEGEGDNSDSYAAAMWEEQILAAYVAAQAARAEVTW